MFWKILFSIIFPIVIFIIVAMTTFIYAMSVNPDSITLGSRLTLGFLFVILPVFYYCLWNPKFSGIVKLVLILAGTLLAAFLRIILMLIGDIITIAVLPNIHLALTIRETMALGIIFLTIYLAKKVGGSWMDASRERTRH